MLISALGQVFASLLGFKLAEDLMTIFKSQSAGVVLYKQASMLHQKCPPGRFSARWRSI
jgi:hypothetical protein